LWRTGQAVEIIEAAEANGMCGVGEQLCYLPGGNPDDPLGFAEPQVAGRTLDQARNGAKRFVALDKDRMEAPVAEQRQSPLAGEPEVRPTSADYGDPADTPPHGRRV